MFFFLKKQPNFKHFFYEKIGNIVVRKPQLYLYNNGDLCTEFSVKLEIPIDAHESERLVSIYPQKEHCNNQSTYKHCWNNLKVSSNGSIQYGDQFYSYLFWESVRSFKNYVPLSTGKSSSFTFLSNNHTLAHLRYLVGCENYELFLHCLLHQLGLSNFEANDFITFWLPELNMYNTTEFEFYVSLLTATTANTFEANIDDEEKSVLQWPSKVNVNIEPKPDFSLRIMMLFKSEEAKQQDVWTSKSKCINEQVLQQYLLNAQQERNKSTICAIEWGGANVTQS